MSPEVRYPTPSEKRRAILLFLFCFFLGLVLLFVFRFFFQGQLELLQDLPQEDFSRVTHQLFGSLMVIVGAAHCWMVVFLWRISNMVERVRIYPPPEMKIIRPVRVYRGRDARRVALLARILVVVVGFSGIGAFFLLLRIAGEFS